MAIAIVAVMDAIFLFPAITTFQQAAAQWSRFESLFDLTAALFLTAWLLGWSIAPLLLTTLLVLLLFGREVLLVRRGEVEILLGLPGVGLAGRFDAGRMRNLRFAEPEPRSGKSWRGPHFAFDYGANEYAFGSNADSIELGSLRSNIQVASGEALRRGDATSEELAESWPEPVSLAVDAAADEPINDPGPEPSLAARATITSPSTLALILANLVPLAGTVFLGWKLSDVMVLYWAESAVIGFYNLCKIAVIGRWLALLAGPFFLGHFGGFMAVHFMFIYTIFVQAPADQQSAVALGEVANLFARLWPALLALFLSHGLSFFVNFIGKGEYRTRTINSQMSEPYSRIVFMHLVLIFGGGLSLVLGEPTPVLLLVIALKMVFDIRAHIRERSRGTAGEAAAK